MSDRSPEDRLAAHLSEGVACLRRGDPARALLHLRPVVEDPSLAETPDLADIRSRALTLCAQALIDAPPPADGDGLQPLEEAERMLDTAVGIDPAAEEAVRPLREALLDARTQRLETAARAKRTARLASTDIEPLLARISDHGRRLDLLLHKAQAVLDAGRPAEAAAFAERILATPPDDVRHDVMARLTLAAAAPPRSEELVLDAYRIAEGRSEFNLVAIVARTAEHLGVPLPTLEGPQLHSEET